jgi:hypothetical protein
MALGNMNNSIFPGTIFVDSFDTSQGTSFLLAIFQVDSLVLFSYQVVAIRECSDRQFISKK